MIRLADHSITVIILAAGLGSRMGARPKLLLPWRNGKPVLWHTAQAALSLEPVEIVLVVRPDLPELAQAVSGLAVRCASNPRYSQGMGTSIATGVAALRDDVAAALVMLGDQPQVSGQIVEGLLDAYIEGRKPVTIPRYGQEVGPPTLFARAVFPELLKLQGDTGGRRLVVEHPELVSFVSMPEELRPHDIDTEEDYRAIL